MAVIGAMLKAEVLVVGDPTQVAITNIRQVTTATSPTPNSLVAISDSRRTIVVNATGAMPVSLAPTGPTDPNFANVSLLLHMDGSDGSTTFADSSNNGLTVTAFGNAQVTNTNPKFGSGALILDGNGDYLTVGSSNALSLGNNDWTIECFVYLNSGNSNVGLFTFGTSYPSTDLGISVTGSDYTLVGIGQGGVLLGSGSLSVWQHFALCRSGANLRAFIDGSQLGSTQSSQGSDYDTLQIGYYYSSSFAISAKIDEFRVTKGIARYTANFTPPTAPFPDA